MLTRARNWLETLLQGAVVFLVVSLTLVVVVAVVFRKAGASFAWYDEVASIMLAWITYYGAALAALNRGHIGFDSLLFSLPLRWRLALLVVGEVFVFGFFILLAWMGWIVLLVLEGDTLVSLPEVSVQITQSVIPIGAALFILCEAVSLPGYWRQVRSGISPHDEVPEPGAGDS